VHLAGYDKAILPGGKGKIRIVLDTMGYGADDVSQNMFIETNDPRMPRLMLTLNCRPEDWVVVEPDTLVFHGPAGRPLTETLTIAPAPGHAFSITAVEADTGGHFSAPVLTPLPDGSGWVLQAANLMAQPGFYVGKITVKTARPIRPAFEIPVAGTIVKPRDPQ
jgi:hypothetical protein